MTPGSPRAASTTSFIAAASSGVLSDWHWTLNRTTITALLLVDRRPGRGALQRGRILLAPRAPWKTLGGWLSRWRARVRRRRSSRGARRAVVGRGSSRVVGSGLGGGGGARSRLAVGRSAVGGGLARR